MEFTKEEMMETVARLEAEKLQKSFDNKTKEEMQNAKHEFDEILERNIERFGDEFLEVFMKHALNIGVTPRTGSDIIDSGMTDMKELNIKIDAVLLNIKEDLPEILEMIETMELMENELGRDSGSVDLASNPVISKIIHSRLAKFDSIVDKQLYVEFLTLSVNAKKLITRDDFDIARAGTSDETLPIDISLN